MVFYLPIFQDVVRLKFWKSWTFLNFRTISAYIDVNFIILWYKWGQNVLLQNLASKNPENHRMPTSVASAGLIMWPGPRLNIKTSSPFNMGNPILVRWHLYIDMASCLLAVHSSYPSCWWPQGSPACGGCRERQTWWHRSQHPCYRWYPCLKQNQDSLRDSPNWLMNWVQHFWGHTQHLNHIDWCKLLSKHIIHGSSSTSLTSNYTMGHLL